MSTEQDISDFQHSPDGKVYNAVYALENAIDELRQASPDVLRFYADHIAAAMLDLGTLLNAVARKDAA